MSHDERVPDNWLETCDHPPVSEWIDKDYPLGRDHSKDDVLKFLIGKKDPSLKHFVTDGDNDLPQSFAHWWLYTRDARRTAVAKDEEPDDVRPEYPTLEKWLPIVQDWQVDNGEVTHADIFGTFKAWLDILFVDMSVYVNEDQREGVPRRLDDSVVWQTQDGVQTRKETMKFIICEGLNIMKERGWSDGYDYWKGECKKYLVFS